MGYSAIVREDTATLAVVRPAALPLDEDTRSVERDRLISEARSAGYADGLAEAREHAQTVADRARAAQESALQALGTAITKTEETLDLERTRLERSAIELAFTIAQAVLTRELALSTSPGLEAIERALAGSPARDAAVCRLNPADADTIADSSCVEGVAKVIADPAIRPGGCILEVGATLVDAQIETALDRVRQVLDEATGQR